MVPWWGIILSVVLGYVLRGVGAWKRSKWQFRRDRADIAKTIYGNVKDDTMKKYEEHVDMYIEIYENEKLKKVFEE